jgi:hypothetical protein
MSVSGGDDGGGAARDESSATSASDSRTRRKRASKKRRKRDDVAYVPGMSDLESSSSDEEDVGDDGSLDDIGVGDDSRQIREVPPVVHAVAEAPRKAAAAAAAAAVAAAVVLTAEQRERLLNGGVKRKRPSPPVPPPLEAEAEVAVAGGEEEEHKQRPAVVDVARAERRRRQRPGSESAERHERERNAEFVRAAAAAAAAAVAPPVAAAVAAGAAPADNPAFQQVTKTIPVSVLEPFRLSPELEAHERKMMLEGGNKTNSEWCPLCHYERDDNDWKREYHAFANTYGNEDEDAWLLKIQRRYMRELLNPHLFLLRENKRRDDAGNVVLRDPDLKQTLFYWPLMGIWKHFHTSLVSHRFPRIRKHDKLAKYMAVEQTIFNSQLATVQATEPAGGGQAVRIPGELPKIEPTVRLWMAMQKLVTSTEDDIASLSTV